MLTSMLNSIESQYAAPQGMVKLTQRGDGNCWARAIAFMIYSDAARHTWVRARVVLQLRVMLLEELLHCLDGGLELCSDNLVLHYTAITEDSSATVVDYLQSLEQAATWAGQLELQAVQRAFNVTVAVWEYNSGAFKQHSMYQCSDNTTALRMLFSGGNHYDTLLVGELQSAEIMAIEMSLDSYSTADTGSSDNSSSSSSDKSSSGKQNGSKKNNNKQQQQQQQQHKGSSGKSKKKGKK
jgi:OTU-like cysteine protease